MSHKRPLDAVAPPEQEAEARSPRKRLRRTVLVMMWLERRRARAATLEQVVRQAQLDMARLILLVMALAARVSSMEMLLLDLPNLIQRLLAEQIGTQIAALHRSFIGSMEDKIQSVLQQWMQEPRAALFPNSVHQPSRLILEGFPATGGNSGVVKLRFVEANRPKDTLYTCCPVQWQNGKNAKVAIFQNEKKITGGDLSKLQIEILPVHDDFFTARGQDDFTVEEFNTQIYSYKGKEAVLTTVNLRSGEAQLGPFFFTESSYGKKLRLIARVKRQDPAIRVQEAITDPFVVKDRRSELNEKSNLPSKEDPIHRLKKISQKGPRYGALAAKNVTKVKHLMRQYHKDKSGLQELTGMKKEDWSTMIEHATKCNPGDEIYSYRVAEENCELLFNDFYDLVGMITNGLYVPVGNFDQFQQRKVNNWKMPAYKKLEERENSGGLTPDYLMSNGCPALPLPLNNEAGPSVQARPTWQYPNDIAAQQDFGEQHPYQQQNGFSLGEVLANNDAGSSMQETRQFTKHTYELIAHQELRQHHPSMPQNGTPYYPTQGNILNGQGSLSRQPVIPSNNLLPVPGSSLVDQQNGYFSSSMTDAPGTSCLVTDGVTQGTSSFNSGAADMWSGLSPIIEEFVPQVNLEDQGFVQDNDEELRNFNI